MSNSDNIERAFQDKFDSDSVSDQGWNKPRDIVWDKIEQDLIKRDKNRFGLPFFLLLAGLLISLVGLGYVLDQNNNLTKQIDEIRIDLETCANKNNIEPTKPIQNEGNLVTASSTDSEDEMLILNQKKDDLKIIKSSVSAAKKVKRKIAQKQELNIQNKFINNVSPTYLTAAKNSYKDKIKNSVKTNETSVSKTAAKGSNKIKRENQILSSIAQREIVLKMERARVRYPNVADFVSTNDNIEPLSLISITGGIMGSKLVNKGNQVSALSEFIDDEYAKLGSVVEVKYTTAVAKKWSLSGGLGLANQEYVTEYDLTLPYAAVDEVIENGIGYIDFEHSLPTSFGNTNTELRLRRADTNQSIEEESVKIDFDTKHRFLSLTAPISIDYLGSDLHSGFFVGLDFIPSYILSARSGISSVLSRHSEIESVNNESKSDYDELEKFNVALGIHAGYRYALSQKSGLEFGASYLQNVNSYFSSQSFSSRSHGIQLSAGYFFRF